MPKDPALVPAPEPAPPPAAARNRGSDMEAPASAPGGPAASGGWPARPEPRADGTTAWNVLLIDDDDVFRTLLRSCLEHSGCVVNEARDGGEGMALADRVLPDVVITDIVMPGRDGFETIGALRQRHPRAIIIAMSGGDWMEGVAYLKTARLMGAHGVLTKPFSYGDLVLLLAECRPSSSGESPAQTPPRGSFPP